jgi:diguanylate cyclase (GGDEF)-like protein/PAS domain S-box-containing protein
MESKTNHLILSEKANYSDLFKRLQFPVFLLDMTNYRILDSNVSCEMFLSVSQEEMIGQSILDWVIESDRNKFARELRIIGHRYYPRIIEIRCAGKDRVVKIVHSTICVLPLSDDRQVIQVLIRDITREREMEDQLKIYLENLEEANRKLEVLSVTDEMTQLANFRHFMSILEEENSRAARYNRPYAIIFSDLDHFKVYNDRHGHLEGDKLLKQVGEILRESCRETDIPARYGGEEFAVLCPELSLEHAFIVAERIRSKIELYPFEHGSDQPLGKVTMSFGVAGFPENGLRSKDILRAADQALYESKEAGRNRVTINNRTKKAAASATRTKS